MISEQSLSPILGYKVRPFIFSVIFERNRTNLLFCTYIISMHNAHVNPTNKIGAFCNCCLDLGYSLSGSEPRYPNLHRSQSLGSDPIQRGRSRRWHFNAMPPPLLHFYGHLINSSFFLQVAFQPLLCCQCCQIAKFDPFLSLDCVRVEGVGAQSKDRKGSNFAA